MSLPGGELNSRNFSFLYRLPNGKRVDLRLHYLPHAEREGSVPRPVRKTFPRVRPIAFYRTGSLTHVFLNEKWLWTWLVPDIDYAHDVATLIPEDVRERIARAVRA